MRGVAKEACTNKLKASVAVTNEWLKMREWLSNSGGDVGSKDGHDLQKNMDKEDRRDLIWSRKSAGYLTWCLRKRFKVCAPYQPRLAPAGEATRSDP